MKTKHTQGLSLLQQQSIRLLQLSGTELQTEIQDQLAENIMLEISNDRDSHAQGIEEQDRYPSGQEYTATTEKSSPETMQQDTAQEAISDWGMAHDLDIDWGQLYEDDPKELAGAMQQADIWEHRDVQRISLRTHLMEQMQHMPLGESESLAATIIIHALNDDGFLHCPLEAIGDHPIGTEQLEKALRVVQSMEPCGVAARNVPECLLLQLRDLPVDTPYLDTAKSLLDVHLLPLLQNRKEESLARALKVSRDTVKKALELLQSLNPSPGSLLGDQSIEYIKPDLFLHETPENGLQLELNEELYPNLGVNPYYRHLLRRHMTRAQDGEDQTINIMRTHLAEARWFKRALQNRGKTLLQVVECIITEQAAFFRNGVSSLRPLLLQHIADRLGIHASTVSRAVHGKYLQTPRSTYQLGYFFSSGITTRKGEIYSRRAVCSKVEQLIREENPNRPLSDSKIMDLLLAQGIPLARRTVAKYRGVLHIPSASQRRQYHAMRKQ